MIKYNKLYYIKNKDKIIERVKNRQKVTKYESEKKLNQKLLRNIKRETRRYFPFIDQCCEICGNEATEHHHNTIPIRFECFNYVCHKCHLVLNDQMKGGGVGERK